MDNCEGPRGGLIYLMAGILRQPCCESGRTFAVRTAGAAVGLARAARRSDCETNKRLVFIAIER